jgi:hypothetical protein
LNARSDAFSNSFLNRKDDIDKEKSEGERRGKRDKKNPG